MSEEYELFNDTMHNAAYCRQKWWDNGDPPIASIEVIAELCAGILLELQQMRLLLTDIAPKSKP